MFAGACKYWVTPPTVSGNTTTNKQTNTHATSVTHTCSLTHTPVAFQASKLRLGKYIFTCEKGMSVNARSCMIACSASVLSDAFSESSMYNCHLKKQGHLPAFHSPTTKQSPSTTHLPVRQRNVHSYMRPNEHVASNHLPTPCGWGKRFI